MVKIKEIILETEKGCFNEIGFDLHTEKLKPVFTSEECATNNEFSCMLDSGAGIPVWCTGKRTLIDAFPTAVLKSDLKGLLGGFGYIPFITEVFYIPKIAIYNGKNSILFKDFYLPVVDKKSFGTDLIIPSSIFKNSNIFISQLESKENQKKLLIQYQAKSYKTQYTKRHLTVTEVTNLKKIKIYKDSNITVDTMIIGGEGEFSKILAQEDLNLLTEKIDQNNKKTDSDFLKETTSNTLIGESSVVMPEMDAF